MSSDLVSLIQVFKPSQGQSCVNKQKHEQCERPDLVSEFPVVAVVGGVAGVLILVAGVAGVMILRKKNEKQNGE